MGAGRGDPGQVGVRAVLGPRACVLGVLRALGEQLAGEGPRRLVLAASPAGRGAGTRARGRPSSAAPRTARAWGWASRASTGRLILGAAAVVRLIRDADHGRGPRRRREDDADRGPGPCAGGDRAARAGRRRSGRSGFVRWSPIRTWRWIRGPRRCCSPPRGRSWWPSGCGRCSTSGATVIMDRFVDSSLAYQGGGRELGVAEIRALNAFGIGDVVVDRTLLLRVSPSVGLGRIAGRDADRLEQAGASSSRAWLRPMTSSPPPSPTASSSWMPPNPPKPCCPKP